MPTRGLKAQHTTANGGIGVSYSQVVLGGGLNPNLPVPPIESVYQSQYDIHASKQKLERQESPEINNFSHQTRFQR